MTRHKEGFDFNIVNIENLPIFYQCFVIFDMHLRKFIQSPIHFATNSAFQILILHTAYINLCRFK